MAIRLGATARDSISGFEGVVVARTEWLYGCVRVTLQPRGLHEGKPVEAQTFDEAQLEVAAQTGGARPDPTRARDPR